MNARLDEAQAGIKIAQKNINNLRYADDTTLLAESKDPHVPAATRENPWVFPLATRWGPIPLHCMQSNCVFPIKHIRIFDLLDWTLESPQQDCHKREEHWCHLRNAKLIGVPQINSRWSTFPLHWIHSRLSLHIIYNKCLDILYNNPEIPWDTHLKSIGTSISEKQQDEKGIFQVQHSVPSVLRQQTAQESIWVRDSGVYVTHPFVDFSQVLDRSVICPTLASSPAVRGCSKGIGTAWEFRHPWDVQCGDWSPAELPGSWGTVSPSQELPRPLARWRPDVSVWPVPFLPFLPRPMGIYGPMVVHLVLWSLRA